MKLSIALLLCAITSHTFANSGCSELYAKRIKTLEKTRMATMIVGGTLIWTLGAFPSAFAIGPVIEKLEDIKDSIKLAHMTEEEEILENQKTYSSFLEIYERNGAHLSGLRANNTRLDSVRDEVWNSRWSTRLGRSYEPKLLVTNALDIYAQSASTQLGRTVTNSEIRNLIKVLDDSSELCPNNKALKPKKFNKLLIEKLVNI